MKKQILIPESQHDITLGAYQNWLERVERNSSKSEVYALECFVELTEAEQKKAKQKDLDEIVVMLTEVLKETHELQPRFTHNGVEYGFIPSLEDITAGEYIDAEKYISSPQTWHNFLAVCYRPIIKTAGNTYTIESYAGSKAYADAMKEVPMSVMTGASVFFYRLSSVLLGDTPSSFVRVQKMHTKLQQQRKRSQRTGDGTRVLTL